MRTMMARLFLVVFMAVAAFSCASTDARMTLGDFMGLCVSGASDDCREVCDDFAAVFVKAYPTSDQCRKACDAVQERLTREDVGRACDSTVGRAAELCAQYCDKNM